MKNENQNQAVIFEPVTPHPRPVAVGELLAEIENTIKRHVVLSDAAATALAVWVLHTWVYERRDTVAYVAIESPEKRCGKTTLLTVLAAMANKPLIASNVTVGALFRAIDTCRPTLFIDEADTFLAGNGIMRGVINSGNTWRTAYVLRLAKAKSKPLAGQRSRDREGAETTGVGRVNEGGTTVENAPDHSPSLTVGAPLTVDTGLQRYSCWCPKVIALIGKAPDTIADRSIVVPMTRKLTTEIRAPLAELDTTAIKAKAARFALDEGPKIATAGKIRGKDLNDRAADTFDPLYVIARLAGKGWEDKLHAAALALFHSHSLSPGLELLLDMHLVFVSTGKKKIFTRHLLDILRTEECGIASFVEKYEGIDEYRISELLRPFGIKPAALRIGTDVGKGYAGEQISEAVARYVPEGDVGVKLREIQNQEKLLEDAIAEEEAAMRGRRRHD